jgi:hypothetical protein
LEIVVAVLPDFTREALSFVSESLSQETTLSKSMVRAFPLVLQMKSQEIIIRSNWKAYLEDFAAAVALAEKQQPCDGDGDAPIAYYYYTATGPTEIDSAQSAWTNFEQKYFDVGETCYELFLDNK